MRTVDKFQINDPEVAKCPFDYYSAMRREDPVHLDPSIGFYIISQYDDVVKAAIDSDALSSTSELMLRKSYRPKAQALWDAAGMKAIDTFVTSDPPEHTEYRRIGLSLFTPPIVEEMTPRIEKLVNELIDNIADKDEIEFIEDFAARLPGTVVADEFGLPREDQPRFKAWTDAYVASISPDNSEEREAELVEKLIEMFKYLENHLKQAAKKSSGRVINTLATMSKRDGSPFSSLERSWMLLVTFVGGNETTMNMLAMSIKKLALNPELQTKLRNNPEKVSAFVEEMLRLEGPVQGLMRVATRDLEIHGTTIPKGSHVILSIGSANRDKANWADPDEFKLDRSGSSRQLSFGKGRHVCLGLHLARRELNIAITQLLKRLNNIELAVPVEQIEQVPLPFHRAIASLPIKFEAIGCIC